MKTVELKPGTGEAITAGKIAVVQYTGWLYETSATDNKGKQFDSSRTGGQPFRFPVGAGQVIKGWDQGVAGMKRGKVLVIPGGRNKLLIFLQRFAPRSAVIQVVRWMQEKRLGRQ